jgi:hypothetical protein
MNKHLNVLTHTGHMESPDLVTSCADGLDDTLPHFTGVQWDSVRATHNVSSEAYAWKTTLEWGRTRPDYLTASWTVATRVASVNCCHQVCCVVRFIPLQGWLLIRISVTPSNMGDGLFTASKCRIINLDDYLVVKVYVNQYCLDTFACLE